MKKQCDAFARLKTLDIEIEEINKLYAEGPHGKKKEAIREEEGAGPSAKKVPKKMKKK